MRRLGPALATALLVAIPVAFPLLAHAAGAVEGGAQQPTNWHAIIMFVLFVCLTLGITYWAAKRTKSAAQFYSAGGGITGFQNGIAIAGDYMSAASFLGISGLVYLSGFDGLIYSVGFLVGWPIVTFLIAEPLRNLGKYTFADVASFRLGQMPIRILAACGSLVTVAFYLIAQMVGAGKLIQVLFGLDYWIAVVDRRRPDDHLRHLRRHARHDLGADHQGRAAARRRDLHGAGGAVASSASARRRCSPRRSRCIQSISPSWSPARWSPIRSRRSRSASR